MTDKMQARLDAALERARALGLPEADNRPLREQMTEIVQAGLDDQLPAGEIVEQLLTYLDDAGLDLAANGWVEA